MSRKSSLDHTLAADETYYAIFSFGNYLWIYRYGGSNSTITFERYSVASDGSVPQDSNTHDFSIGNDGEIAYSAATYGERGYIHTQQGTTHRLRAIEYNGSTHAVSHDSDNDFTLPTVPTGTFYNAAAMYEDLSLIHISEPTRPY